MVRLVTHLDSRRPLDDNPASMKFAVTVVAPPGYPHSAAFVELAETLHAALTALGHDSVLTTEGRLPGRQPIVLGTNLLPAYPLPLAPDAILYNLEQVQLGSSWFRPELLELFRRYTLWDYSRRNVAALAALEVPVARLVPIGYVPELTRIEPARDPDLDVLFFGSMNPRRIAIIERLRAAGLRAEAVFGVYGKARDDLIARAKIVLNVHFYEAKVLEMVRISYLLANRCCVLSEASSDPEEDEALAPGVAFAAYDDLVPRAQELVADAALRAGIAQRGFELMRQRSAIDYLRAALDPTRTP
jgi:hypothetical protein